MKNYFLTNPRKAIVASVFLITSLSGCVGLGISPAHEELRLACLNEAEVVNGEVHSFRAPVRGRSAPRIPKEVYRAKKLCRDLVKLPNLAQNGALEYQKEKDFLTKEYTSFLREYASKYPSDTKHVAAMKDIYQKMTNYQDK